MRRYYRRNTSGEGGSLDLNWLMRLESVGSRAGLDTLVVHAVNDGARCRGPKGFGAAANAISIPPGKYVRKIKLKELTGPAQAVEHGLIRSNAKNNTSLDIPLTGQ